MNPSAIYAINPVDNETMMYMVGNISAKPIQSWDINTMHKKLLALQKDNQQEINYEEDN